MSKRPEAPGGDGGGHEGDTAKVPIIPSASLEDLSLAETQRERIPGADPYNSAPVSTPPAPRHLRRDLEDMLQLSTPIKAETAGHRSAVTPTSDLALRLAGMRVELERVLSDMETQRGVAVDHADRRAAGLLQKLRESARHLEDAIDSLLPPDAP